MFYTFSQNNSGGYFTGPAQYVIIEADSRNEAKRQAEERYGLYFDGEEDCPCCGNRWSGCYDGTEKPEIYGKPPEEHDGFGDEVPVFVVYYKYNPECTAFRQSGVDEVDHLTNKFLGEQSV